MTSRHLFSRLLGAILVVSALASCSDGGKKPPHESSAKPEDVLDKIVIDNPKPNKNDPFGIGKHDKTIKHSKTVKYVIASKQRGLKSSTTSTIRIDAKTRITEVKVADDKGKSRGKGDASEAGSAWKELSYYDGSGKPPPGYSNEDGWHKERNRGPNHRNQNEKSLLSEDEIDSLFSYFTDLEDLTITEVGQAYLITGHPSGTKDKNTATSADNIATDIGTAGALDPDKSMVSVTIDKKTRRIQSMETRIVMTHNGKVVAEQTDSLKYDWNPVDVSVPPEAKSAVDG